VIWNPPAETLPASARAALQLERLRATVAWAVACVPFHRARLGAARLAGLADLAALPCMRKSDLREHYPFGLCAVPPAELARVHASSGTKGKPTVVGYTAADLDVWREVMARAMTAAGARAGDMLHVAFGYGLFTGGLGFHDGAERIGMTVVPVSSGNTARHHLLLQDFRPAALCGTPSFVLHIAESLREQGGDPRALGVRYGMFGAEPWTEGLRAAISIRHDHPRTGILVFSQYVETRYAADLLRMRSGGVGYLLKDRVANVAEFSAALLGSAALVLLTIINCIGVRAGSVTQNVFMILKLIAIATLAVTGLLIAVDALRSSGAQSHVARAVEGRSSAWAIITRKVHLQWVTTVHTIWTPAILVFAGAVAIVLWRRRDLVARALEWHTLLRPALLAALVGGIAGFVFNDGGVLVTAPIAMFAAAVVFSTLLTPG